MKKHDEDLWDFRSDPLFANDNRSSDNPPPQDETAEDSDYNEYKEEYVDILRTSTAKDSSLDNMTFVMKDGKASFIDSSLLETAKKEAKKEKATLPKPADKQVASNVSKPAEEKALPAEPEITKTEAPVAEENKVFEATPVVSPAPQTEGEKQEAAQSNKTEKPLVTSEKAIKEETLSPSSEKREPRSSAEDKPAKPSAKPIEESNPSENNAPKKKVPATDSDFIFAKPHSKKSHSHHSSSHSHSSHSHSTDHSNEAALPTDNVDDYVYARYRKQSGKSHHQHRSKSSHSEYINTEGNESTLVVRSTTSTHFRQRRRKKKDRKWHHRPLWQKTLIVLGWVFGILFLLLLIAFILFLIFSKIGISNMTDYNNVKIETPAFESVDVKVQEDGKVQIYNGKKYRLNTDIANILCIGVDKKSMYENQEGNEYSSLADNGQSDALFMVALNTKTGKTKVLSIPRDTMSDINIYNEDGKFLKTANLQICQAFAYGKNNAAGAQNTIDAVSRLFYQLPIQTHFAMDLSAIAPINDAVGGVTLTMIDNSFYDVNHTHHEKGKTITLFGDNARKYVQQRDVNELESTTDRLSRQIHYLKAFSAQTLEMTKRDITTPVNLYNLIEKRSISNLDVYKISALAKCLIENGVTSLDFATIPGELQSDGTYAQYIVDREAFYELFLETYYVPVE